MQGRHRQGAHRHLLVGFHAIQHHLDDLSPQPDALLGAVLGIGQVEEGGAAGDLDVLVVLMALEGRDDQLYEDRVQAWIGESCSSCIGPRALRGGSARSSGVRLTPILFSGRSEGWGQKLGQGHGAGTRPVLGQTRPRGAGVQGVGLPGSWG